MALLDGLTNGVGHSSALSGVESTSVSLMGPLAATQFPPLMPPPARGFGDFDYPAPRVGKQESGENENRNPSLQGSRNLQPGLTTMIQTQTFTQGLTQGSTADGAGVYMPGSQMPYTQQGAELSQSQTQTQRTQDYD